MSGGGGYQRASKRHAVLVEHIGGATTEGFLMVPIGVVVDQYIHQIENFFPLEAMDGRKLFISARSVQSIYPREEDSSSSPIPQGGAQAQPPPRESPPPPPRPGAARAASSEEGGAVARRFQQHADAEALRRREQAARELVERQRRERQKRAADERRRRREEEPDAVAAIGLLGLEMEASLEDVQAAYRREVKIYHPDRLRGLGAPEADIARAHERLTFLNRAYQILAALEAEGVEESEPIASA